MKNADVTAAETSGQLRMKSMSWSATSSTAGDERRELLRIECDTLTKKVRLLESQYLARIVGEPARGRNQT